MESPQAAKILCSSALSMLVGGKQAEQMMIGAHALLESDGGNGSRFRVRQSSWYRQSLQQFKIPVGSPRLMLPSLSINLDENEAKEESQHVHLHTLKLMGGPLVL